MEDAVHALIEILTEEKMLSMELLSLAEEQREALMARQTEALTEITLRQTKLLSSLQSMETDGKNALDILRSLLGLETNASLAEVAGRINPEQAETMLQLRDEILKITRCLSQANRINAELFETAMESIRFTFKLLSRGATLPSPAYSLHPSPSPASSLMVDRRA